MAQLDIDTIYERLVLKMQVQDKMVNHKFALCDNNFGRVWLAYYLLKKYRMFPDFIKVEKKCEESEKYRNMGNVEFKRKIDKKALKMYNKAITFAPLNSQQLYLAYSNRSAANYSLKNYAECLKDIETVLSFDQCTAELRERLIKRKARCEKALEENSPVNDIDDQCREKFKLSYNPHKTIPFASDSLEISYSEEMGRGVVATRDIKPGDVLVLEEPYSAILLDDYYTEHCYGCLKRCDSMIPCDNCCYVMFCNDECKQKAYNDYHTIDCKIMPLLLTLKFTKIELLALHTVIQAKCTHDSCKSLSQVISEAEAVKDPLTRGYSVNQGVKIYDSLQYCAIHMLESNVEKRNLSDILQKTITAAVFLHFLLEYTEFFKDCGVTDKEQLDNNECVQLYGGLLLHHSMTTPLNGINIGTEASRYGSGFYAFLSLVNHSCAPNSMRFLCGSTMALVTLRSVKKGQQIYINYRGDFSSCELCERQAELKFQYKFECRCEACLNNWPLFEDLGRAQAADDNALQSLPRSVSIHDASEAFKMINKLYTYVAAVEKYAPCKDLIVYQNAIIKCWLLFESLNNPRVLLLDPSVCLCKNDALYPSLD